MIEAGWSARQLALQLGRCDCVVRRCWDQDMSFTRRPGSGYPRQISCRENHHIVRNARVLPTAALAAVQAQLAPSLEASVYSRTMQRCLAEGHLGLWRPLRAALDIHPSTTPFGVVPRTRKLDCSGMEPGCL
ncbi:HTH_Tnp_Tc3_2 domain-containing protein [Trichonephila clavipes]|nr:HTH_Tnp_Tc3_2 domain-containing protein [Trichonephila clavipes]